ncbi:hypothetical protein QMK61_02220 [Fulvimonas sp. R45]|uniref:hypothetical protein n=1 Tax=Fulvimonas sp. R45 TaxID=3045937 RepID=UPI00265F2CDE|nr:hypothetical protein [Fulvimonas sp. R45]MDO1527636.1 hypothetical protein [Fulvimonas sp. R45]
MLSRPRVAGWILFWAGFALVGTGFVVESMWTGMPWGPLATLAKVALVAWILTYGLRRLFRCHVATAAAGVWLAALAYYGGLAPMLAVLLVAAAAMALGSLIVPKAWEGRAPLSVLAGLALISGIIGWLLPYQVHGHAVYLLALLLICVVRWRAMADILRPLPRAWSDVVGGAPRMALLAVMVVGVVSTCAWVPTIHYDDLAYHLGLPYQLDTLGYYRMDVGSRLWAVSAWAGDIVQGMAFVTAGADARGAVDALWLVLAVAGMWKLCEVLELNPGMRWLAVAIYASMPLTAGTLTGMQTEGPTAAVAVGAALLIAQTSVPDRRRLLTTALLFGLLLGLKVSNLMTIGPLGLWMLLRWWRDLPWRFAPVAAVCALAIAGSSYFYAYILTGNPTLPIFNGYFHSTYYAFANFHDDRWDTGLPWNILWKLVFDASDYAEASSGVAGFTLLALLGSLLVAITNRRARPLALVAALAFALPLTQIQYLRYAHPAMVLLVPAMLRGVPAGAGEWRYPRAAMVALVLLVLGNLAFVPNGDWQLRQGVLRQLTDKGATSVIDTYAPTRHLAEIIRRHYGDQARTLLVGDDYPFAAELAGNAFVVNWYDQQLAVQVDKARVDASGKTWLALFERTGVNLLILRDTDLTPALDAAIRQDRGVRVYKDGAFELWKLNPGIDGNAEPAPANAVIIGFDMASAPPHATLVHADVRLHCKVTDIPIVIGWNLAQAGGKSWTRYEWAKCLPTGMAEASLDVALPGRVTGFVVKAAPARPADLGLQLASAKASLRRDFAAERDLAKRFGNPVDMVKEWNHARLLARRAKR